MPFDLFQFAHLCDYYGDCKFRLTNPAMTQRNNARQMKHVPNADSLPHVHALRDSLEKSLFAASTSAIDRLCGEYGNAYLDDFESHLGLLKRAFPERGFPDWAARGFQRFGSAVLREEAAFKQTGRYSAGPEELQSLKDDFYGNADVMEGYYLVGLFCTYFLWPHHYRLLNFFRDDFLALPDEPTGLVMDWGPGHGLLSVEALGTWGRSPALLIDISRQSLEFSKAMLSASGMLERCELRQADILTLKTLPQADRVICGELLEHVPDPRGLIGMIRSSLRPGGKAFLTGAINAPQPDHIFLFRSAGELLDLVESEGFVIRSHLTVRHPNRDSDATAPEVTAMVVEHAA